MKRKRSLRVGGRAPKRPNQAVSQSALATSQGVDHPVLRRLYPEVLTLRHYLLSRLPSSSKNRRRKISQLGVANPGPDDHHDTTTGTDVALGQLLDSTLVGVPRVVPAASAIEDAKARNKDIHTFSQQLPDGGTGSTFKPGYFEQSEVVEFVIWRLFKRSPSHRPAHILCHGFQRAGMHGPLRHQTGPPCQIPGLAAQSRNTYAATLKGPEWCRMHAILGPGGDSIMMDLLLDCAIFSQIDVSSGNYVQISGLPVSDFKAESVQKDDAKTLDANKKSSSQCEAKRPGQITFVRNRMLYARAAINAKGGVRFGMRHIHVLNRLSKLDDHDETVHIMRYIFPRQFGLHNAFTSTVDVRETAMPFKDYTLREKEIKSAFEREARKKNLTTEQIAKRKQWLPKRLRGEPVALVQRMRKLNRKCSYMELLRHYCPVEGLALSTRPEWRKSHIQPKATSANDTTTSDKKTTTEQTSFTDFACPAAHVSAFCRAAISNVIPNGFFGTDTNKRTILYWVDQFICMRKFESITLHQAIQKVQISDLAWLRVPGQDPNAKLPQSDSSKRLELFCELVYWLFDSYLVPLIRSNFHVTESNVHRNRLFYFRHDVWRMLTEPSLASLRLSMFEEVPMEKATKILAYRPLGFSKVRLLPKSTGIRLITNLKRRQQIMRNGTMMLGRSINGVMGPVFNVMTYEKSLQPERFGSSLFSVGDMFPKLHSFRKTLQSRGLGDSKLYFAKVDVQSCFDNIPQQRLLSMVESLISMKAYQTGKHIEVSPMGPLQRLDGQYVEPLPLRRYIPHTGAAEVAAPFSRVVREQFVGTKSNTVFVDTAAQRLETKDDLMHLLREHVERNLVKFGKRFYRQKKGIPQGSVLSNILCNFFYAEFEREDLAFALDNDSLLLRLLDDFCLITIKQEHAERFIHVMHRGNAEYGVSVKASKSLANFDVAAGDGLAIPRSVSDVEFPYCGVLIDTQTLEVRKASQRAGHAHVVDSLTVDMAKVPGQTFHRKALNAFKIQLQAMFIDTSLNTVPTVLANLYSSFHEAAVRCFEYVRSLSRSRPTHPRLLTKTVEGIIALAFVMLQRRSRTKARQLEEGIRSAIPRRHVQW